MSHGRISLNSVLLLMLVNFASRFRLELMYISPIKSVKSSVTHPWFSAACAAAIVHRNQFFHLHGKDKSSKSKVTFRQASSLCKRVLQAAKRAYANKTKKPSLPRNLALGTFGELRMVFLTKVNLVYLLYSIARRCCPLHLIKQNC